MNHIKKKKKKTTEHGFRCGIRLKYIYKTVRILIANKPFAAITRIVGIHSFLFIYFNQTYVYVYVIRFEQFF